MKLPFGRLAALVLAMGALPAALAQAPAVDVAVAAPPKEPPTHSRMDAPLFYQLLVGELELRGGKPGNAYQAVLDAARRTKDEALFRRAVEIALQGRAGDEALAAAVAWREAQPQSLEALRTQVQLLAALNRTADTAEPVAALLRAAPAPEQPAIISALPRLYQRASDKRLAAELLDKALAPYLDAPGTRTAARAALGRAWLQAGEPARALALAERAQADEPAAPGAVLLALELLPGTPAAEKVVRTYLAQPKPEPMVRMAYVRMLTGSQRYSDAVVQLERVTAEQPELAAAWLQLGAIHLELREPAKAEQALQRYVQLAQAGPTVAVESDDDELPLAGERARVTAWLLLAQAAEMRGDFRAAEEWLKRVDDPQRALEVQSRRASILVRQNRIADARELIRRTPERNADDARAKLVAEAQVLRDAKRWREAYDVLGQASQRFKDDADLIYEQAMTAEKLDRMDDMESLLKRVIALKPDFHHAYNALGYSLADRNRRLPEARELIAKALSLAPGDPFITDSMGWLEYRAGRRDEALKLLRQAYAARPDVEIAAHLGEVLWVDGQRDEARRVLRDARGRDASNEVLRETVARLKVDL